MKTLLLNAGLREVKNFALKAFLASLLFKFLMIAGIGFLTFIITSKNYSQLREIDNKINFSQQESNHPPAPFSY